MRIRTSHLGRALAVVALVAATMAAAHGPALAAPRIRVSVTASPDFGTPGTRIDFTYVVTNTGDVPLFDVSVADDVVGDVGSLERLGPGRSVAFTAQTVLRGAPIQNAAVVRARDRDGTAVRDRDVARVTVIAPEATPATDPSANGLAFTGATFGAIAAVAAILLLLGVASLAVSRRGDRERYP